MKILICAQQFFPDTVGGSARVAFEQARELVKQGAQVWAIVPKMSGDMKDSEINEGVKIHRYGTGRQHPLGQSFVDVTRSRSVIEEIAQREKPDVVIIHQPTIGYVCVKYIPHIPRVYMFHASVAKEVRFQGLTGKGRWKRLFGWLFVRWLEDIEAKTIESSGRVLVLSQYSQRLASRSFPSVRDRIVLIPTGIDTERFKPIKQKNIVRSIVGMPEDRVVFLTVRRLVPRMGLENLISAVCVLVDEFPDIAVYIVGEGPLFESLRRRVRTQGLDGNIFLTGRVKEDDLHMFYQAADCFVLSTRAYEGLGIATLEALASGLPVLGTPVGATKEILRKVDKRLLLDGAQAADIARGMKWFLEEGMHDETLARKARACVLSEYTWQHAGETVYTVLEEYIKSYD